MNQSIDDIQTNYVRVLAKALMPAHTALSSAYDKWHVRIEGSNLEGWQCKFEQWDKDGLGTGESFHIDPTTVSNATDDPLNAMLLLTLLRQLGFTVDFSGTNECWATVSTENSDVSSTAHAKQTEEALFYAVHHLYTHLTEIVEALKPYSQFVETRGYE